MKITRNVILDLLPLYQTGEASSETKALVEEFLRQDPEFAQKVRETSQPRLDTIPVDLPPDHEIKTLEKTKRMIRLRSWLMAFAIFFTLLLFSGADIEERINWFMWRDAPAVARLSLLVGIGFWVVYYITSRRLRSTSL